MHDKSLKELCGQLSISIATGRNWVKLGKITPQYIKNGVPYFDEKHIAIIENEIRSGKNVALKSRRNKKYVSGNALYRSYVSKNCKNLTVLQKLLSEITREQILLTSDVLFCGRLCVAVIPAETIVFPISAGENFYREI